MFSDTKAAGRLQEQVRRQVQNLNGFDYGAAAELFPSRSKAAKSRAKYMRFDTAAEAVRLLVEDCRRRHCSVLTWLSMTGVSVLRKFDTSTRTPAIRWCAPRGRHADRRQSIG
jgi:hypothetical protein